MVVFDVIINFNVVLYFLKVCLYSGLIYNIYIYVLVGFKWIGGQQFWFYCGIYRIDILMRYCLKI